MNSHFEGGDLKTAAKLVILEECLDVYTTIMDVHWGEYWYVDTHSGTGRTMIGDVEIDGSAIIALDNYSDMFSRFYFYELDADSFQTLHQTITDRLGYEFEVSETNAEDKDFLVASCEDPYIRIMQMDSNEGVSFLAEHANPDPHWFVFVDPKGLTARRSTIDTLIERGNLDLLITYQTSGVLRSAAEGAEHAHGAVERTLGDSEWPNAGSPDDYVDEFKERLEENELISPVKTKRLVSPTDRRMVFDLVFACTNETVRNVIKDEIMDQDNLWAKANNRIGQSDLSGFS